MACFLLAPGNKGLVVKVLVTAGLNKQYLPNPPKERRKEARETMPPHQKWIRTRLERI